MAPGDTMVGRRLPIVKTPQGDRLPWNGVTGHGFEPGDYCGPIVGYTGEKPSVFFLLPTARDEDAPAPARSIRHVCSPPHVFRECADGSLEIRESISDQPGGTGWHGYLDEGHLWRQV